MKHWLLFIIVLLFLPLVSAVNYDSYSMEAEVLEKTVFFTIDATATFDNELLLTLPPSVKDLFVEIDGTIISCTSVEDLGFTRVSCPIQEGLHSIYIEFSSAYPLVPLNGETYFQLDHEIESESFRFMLKLPIGSIIEDQRLITPEPTNLYSDGKRIILVWEENNYSDTFQVSLLFHSIVRQNYTWLWILLIIFSIGALVYYFKRDKIQKSSPVIPEEKKEDPSDVLAISKALLENEKKVIEALSDAKDNQLWQKELQIKTALPKVKLSRLLQSLEKRGLIEKENYGASNIIKLKKESSPPPELQ